MYEYWNRLCENVLLIVFVILALYSIGFGQIAANEPRSLVKWLREGT